MNFNFNHECYGLKSKWLVLWTEYRGHELYFGIVILAKCLGDICGALKGGKKVVSIFRRGMEAIADSDR
jgi:hypothetical protein